MLIGLAACGYSLLTLALTARASEFGDAIQMYLPRVVAYLLNGDRWCDGPCALGEWVVAGMTAVLTCLIVAVLRIPEKQTGRYTGKESERESKYDAGQQPRS